MQQQRLALPALTPLLPPSLLLSPLLFFSLLLLLLPSAPALGAPRYKLFVQVVVGEAKGQGVRVATRALWDTTTDMVASEQLFTDALFAVATVYAVYHA